MLEILGLSDVEERTYLTLLKKPAASLSEVSSRLGATEPSARSALQSLEAKGLVSRRPEREAQFVAARTSAALEVLILRRQEELESVRVLVAELFERVHSARQAGPVEFLEIVSGREAVAQRFEQIQLLAKEEVCICDKAPYANLASDENVTELKLLSKGVGYRAIYDAAALELPDRIRTISTYIESGEQARTTTDLPMKLAITDQNIGLLPLNIFSPDQEMEAVVIHPSSLMDALVTLFESLWERSMPLALHGDAVESPGESHREEISVRDQNILSLLSAGLSDAAVSRQLGMGIRTVQRRMNVLMTRLGARTRFQAALLASRRGWLEDNGEKSPM